MPVDKLNDTRSLDRALTRRLVLLVKRKSDGLWTFPQGVRNNGERMVDAAKRHMLACYGPKLREWYPGNGPMGHKLVVYSPEKQKATGVYGEKVGCLCVLNLTLAWAHGRDCSVFVAWVQVFFYRAQIFRGRIRLGPDYEDYQWLTRVCVCVCARKCFLRVFACLYVDTKLHHFRDCPG